MLTLEQLTTPVTEDEALDFMLGVLSSLGFQGTSWQPGSAQLTILRLFARVYSRLTTVITQIAGGGYTTLARGVFLTLVARYVYDLERLEATPTIGKIVLTNSPGAPTHTWLGGDIIVADAEEGTDGANTYTIQAAGSLAPGQSLSFDFQADVPGSAANIAPNTPLFLWTPLVGVVATNPPVPPSNTWIATTGEDEEQDDRLVARCLGRWSRLTYGNTDGAYRGWALEALSALTRVSIAAAPGDGTVTIYGATALGPLTPEQCTEIEEFIYGASDGVGRRPINDIVSVEPAAVQAAPALTVTAYVESGDAPTAGARITQALLVHIGSLPIGGVRLQGSQGRVIYSQLVEVAQDQQGVRSVAFSISSDVLLDPDEIYVPAITVNVIPVAPS